MTKIPEGPSAENAALFQRISTEGGVVDLSSRTKLRFSGADRLRYLNGQLTARVSDTITNATRPACVTTARGRLCAEVFFHLEEQSVLLDADRSVGEPLRARLEQYIIADDVVVADVTQSLTLCHVIDPLSGASKDVILPESKFAARRLGVPGWDFFMNAESPLQQLTELRKALPALNEAIAECLRIERGVPRWGYELDESTLPPEASLESTHIDYDKGCYVGQEVISRLRSVGHVNRQMVGYLSPTGAVLTVGSKIYSAENSDRDIGVVTSSAWSYGMDQYIAIGYLKRGAVACLARDPQSPALAIPITVSVLPFVS